MEKINALIEKLQELKNSNAGLQTISYYVQLLQAEVLHTRNAQLQQKNTQTNIAVIMPSDRMAAHNTLPPAEQVQAPVAPATAPVPATPENIPAPAAAAVPTPAPREENIPAAATQSSPPPPANHPPKEEARPVILHIPKLVAAYTPPVVKHPPPPAPEAPVHTVPASAPAATAPVPAQMPPPAASNTAAAAPTPAPAQVPPMEPAPAATYTPPAVAMPAANHTVPPVPPMTPPAPPAEVPAVAAAAKPVPPAPKPAPATLFDTSAPPAPAHHNGHRQEQHAENHSIRKELNELVGQSQSGTSLNERLKTANVEVAEKLREMGVKDLRDAIGINDKFQFIQELFRGDRDMYDRSVKTINECTSLQEAEYWIQRELKIYQGWQDDDSLVKHFYSLVKKRFS